MTLTGLSRVVEGELRRDVHRWVDDMGPLPGEDFTVRLGERGLVLGGERIGGREWHRVLFPQGIGLASGCPRLVESMWLLPA